MDINATKILGVRFSNCTKAEALEHIKDRILSNVRTTVYTPNAEIAQQCIESENFCNIVNAGDLIIPDGIGIIKAAKMLRTPLKEKIPGVELGEEILKLSKQLKLKVFFFGGNCGDSKNKCVSQVCSERFKKEGVDIVGFRHGYYKKVGEENRETLKIINSSGAQVLFVCLGSPLQETWINENMDYLPNIKVFLALGGSLDVYSGSIKRAPELFIKLGLEWLYRLIKEPKRIKRISKLPRFYFTVLKHKMKYTLAKNK
ncbi:MAG: WecB/TagA/CpsF family glycosyltransferase [Ruminococcaceae bacterium]|nr:WecB/TagA/CpsF family glycosyltransferase [Oscillospiraceae bacterium]